MILLLLSFFFFQISKSNLPLCSDVGGMIINGHCYGMFHSDKQLNWVKAEEKCRNWTTTAHLAYIPHQTANDKILDYFLSEYPTSRKIFIGLTDFIWKNVFFFIGGEPIFHQFPNDNLGIVYTNWAPNEPDLTCLECRCVVMNGPFFVLDGGKWDTINCVTSVSRDYACSYDVSRELLNSFDVTSFNMSSGTFETCIGDINCYEITSNSHGKCLNINYNSTDTEICYKCNGNYNDFKGQHCEQIRCWETYSDREFACGGNGICINVDHCVCNIDWFGDKCWESISNVTFYNYYNFANGNGDSYIDMNYFVPLSVWNSKGYSLLNFNCNEIFTKETTILFGNHNDYYCEIIKYEPVWTESLRIHLGNNHNINDESILYYKVLLNESIHSNKIIERFITRGIHIKGPGIYIDPFIIIFISLSCIFIFILLIFIIIIIIFIIILIIILSKKNTLKDEIQLIDEKEANETIAKLEVNKDLFCIDFKDIKLKKSIGKGGFSTVYEGSLNDVTIAFKSFNTKEFLDTKNNFKDFEREATLIASLSHPNILIFYGAVLAPPRVGLVLEHCSNGTIENYMIKHVMNFSERIRILKEISLAMKYLHAHSIIHRDLKPDNILLTKNLIAKIIDFGLSKVFKKQSNNTMRIGTSFFMSPQVFKGELYTQKCDVFSYGIIMWCCLSNEFFPYGKKAFGIENKVSQDETCRPNMKILKDKIPKEGEFLKKMICKCWSHDEQDRPEFEDIFKELNEFESTILLMN